MELTDIYTYTGIGVVLILSIFIKIPKLELNVWKWLGKSIGNSLNHDVIDRLDKTDKKIDDLKTELDKHVKVEEVARIDDCRKQILQFNDEILARRRHSKETFDQNLLIIDKYEKYCDSHPDYPNNQALLAIANIKKVYSRRLEKGDFALPDYKE